MVLCLVGWSGKSTGWSVDLDLEIDTALRKQGEYAPSRNTGAYLRDSFRSEILAPSFRRIIRAIENVRDSDIKSESTLGGILAVVAALSLYLLYSIKCQRRKKGKKRAILVPEVTMGKDETMKVKMEEDLGFTVNLPTRRD